MRLFTFTWEIRPSSRRKGLRLINDDSSVVPCFPDSISQTVSSMLHFFHVKVLKNKRASEIVMSKIWIFIAFYVISFSKNFEIRFVKSNWYMADIMSVCQTILCEFSPFWKVVLCLLVFYLSLFVKHCRSFAENVHISCHVSIFQIDSDTRLGFVKVTQG